MSLKQWLDNAWLVAHRSSAEEIAGLFEVVERDINDAQTARLSDDWRFGISYNAALQLATIALYASGYRASRGQSHHLRAIQSLRFTINLDQETVDQLDGFRAKRHANIYDVAGSISHTEADEMFGLAKSLQTRVRDWIRRKYPDFSPD